MTSLPVDQILARRTVLVVAAHPDDETVSAAGLLQRLHRPVIVHLTDGAPRRLEDARAAGYSSREDYARARRQELAAALEVAGIGGEQRRSLAMVDQEASFALAEIALRLIEMSREIRPGAVVTHPYEGGHPDHDATAFAVHAACARMAPAPDLFEFTSYHAAPDSHAAIETGRFLPGTDSGEPLVLSGQEREIKRRMIDCFPTQLLMLRHFPVDMERFRPAPAYDFTQAPHAGKLYYENFDWGVTGTRWRALAEEAMRTLSVRGAA